MNYKEWHLPKFYRYKIANPGFRIGWNRYPGVKIGAYVNIGRYSYCVKWAYAVLVRKGKARSETN